jgi:hypothetical protein
VRLDHDEEQVLGVGNAGHERSRHYRHDQVLGQWCIAEPGRQHPVVALEVVWRELSKLESKVGTWFTQQEGHHVISPQNVTDSTIHPLPPAKAYIPLQTTRYRSKWTWRQKKTMTQALMVNSNRLNS